MSTRTFAWLTVVAALTLLPGGLSRAQTPAARLGTFEKDGREFFALSLMPQAAADPSLDLPASELPLKDPRPRPHYF